jgi:hypothetical protein
MVTHLFLNFIKAGINFIKTRENDKDELDDDAIKEYV